MEELKEEEKRELLQAYIEFVSDQEDNAEKYESTKATYSSPPNPNFLLLLLLRLRTLTRKWMFTAETASASRKKRSLDETPTDTNDMNRGPKLSKSVTVDGSQTPGSATVGQYPGQGQYDQYGGQGQV